MPANSFARIFSLTLSVLTLAALSAEWWSYPDKIEVHRIENDDPTIAVTKSKRLPDDFVPPNLVVIQPDVFRTKKETMIREELLIPLKALRLAAEKDGIDLVVLSGYRSFERQKTVHEYWVKFEGGNREAAEKYSARPGHSEHQLGTVVDFSTQEINDAIGSKFHQTKAAAWLRKNAGDFGFRLSYPKGAEQKTGYQWESWHWRWWPEEK